MQTHNRRRRRRRWRRPTRRRKQKKFFRRNEHEWVVNWWRRESERKRKRKRETEWFLFVSMNGRCSLPHQLFCFVINAERFRPNRSDGNHSSGHLTYVNVICSFSHSLCLSISLMGQLAFIIYFVSIYYDFIFQMNIETTRSTGPRPSHATRINSVSIPFTFIDAATAAVVNRFVPLTAKTINDFAFGPKFEYFIFPSYANCLLARRNKTIIIWRMATR